MVVIAENFGIRMSAGFCQSPALTQQRMVKSSYLCFVDYDLKKAFGRSATLTRRVIARGQTNRQSFGEARKRQFQSQRKSRI
jgi:hypothetical protein